jgi:hypothetical protein
MDTEANTPEPLSEDITTDPAEELIINRGKQMFMAISNDTNQNILDLHHNQLRPFNDPHNDEQKVNESALGFMHNFTSQQHKDEKSSKTSTRPSSQNAHKKSTQSTKSNHGDVLVESYSETELENIMHTPKRQLRRTKKRLNLHYESDFDPLFSSSPLGHSTPRIRLEPTNDDGKRVLKSVSAHSPSRFNSASEIDGLDDADVFIPRQTVPNSRKKHPSPSKAELEDLEHAMETIGMLPRSPSNLSNMSKSSKRFSKLLAPVSILASKDPNINFSATKGRTESKRQSKVVKAEMEVRNP